MADADLLWGEVPLAPFLNLLYEHLPARLCCVEPGTFGVVEIGLER